MLNFPLTVGVTEQNATLHLQIFKIDNYHPTKFEEYCDYVEFCYGAKFEGYCN